MVLLTSVGLLIETLRWFLPAVFPGRIVAVFPLLFSLSLVAQVQISSTLRKHCFVTRMKTDTATNYCNLY